MHLILGATYTRYLKLFIVLPNRVIQIIKYGQTIQIDTTEPESLHPPLPKITQ